MHTLVAVTQRAKARFFLQEAAKAPLVEIATLEHPESRKPGRDLESDRPGRTQDSKGQGRHAMAVEETHKEREAANFARTIAEDLKTRRNDGVFNQLVLVAEPGFLGLLRDALDGPTQKLVIGEVKKNLTDHKAEDLHPHLSDLLIL
jgi:protein required for attachment to host cells